MLKVNERSEDENGIVHLKLQLPKYPKYPYLQSTFFCLPCMKCNKLCFQGALNR